MANKRNHTSTYHLKGARAQGSEIKVTSEGVEYVSFIAQGDIEILIDVEELFRTLGGKALVSRTRKAVLGGGVIVAKATNVVKTPAK